MDFHNLLPDLLFSLTQEELSNMFTKAGSKINIKRKNAPFSITLMVVFSTPMKMVALFICTMGCSGNQCCPSINAVDMGRCCGTDLWGMWILRVLLDRVSVSFTLLLHLKEVLSETQCDVMFVMLFLSYV